MLAEAVERCYKNNFSQYGGRSWTSTFTVAGCWGFHPLLLRNVWLSCWSVTVLVCSAKKKRKKEMFKLEPVHWNWCLFTHPHQTRAKSYHTSPCIFAGVGTSIYYFAHFNYLQSATTCEKSLKPNKTVVSIRMHHIYSLFLQDENNVTLFSLVALSSVPTTLKCGSCCCFHLESCGP